MALSSKGNRGSICSIDDHKDVRAADHMPVAALPVPVAILVRMPVGVIPIGIGVDNGRTVPIDSAPIGSGRVISAIRAPNSRAAFAVHRRAVTGLNCCAMPVMSGITVFTLIRVGVKRGGG